MKKIFIYLLAFTSFSLGSCTGAFNELENVKEITPVKVNVSLNIDAASFADSELTELNDLTFKFDNYEEDLHYVVKIEDANDFLTKSRAASQSVTFDQILPGIYTVTISGVAIDEEGNEYYLSGNLVNYAFYGDAENLNIKLQGLKVSPLVFKEIYYCGCYPPSAFYFRDQFYEIYNNSSSVQYLDGIHFANLTPGTATTKLPVWPESDGDNYVYGDRVWKFPGNGTDYPLQPGESVVISQFAANHQLEQYNPNSPIDGSSSEFEFNMNNTDYPDQPAYDMLHVFYNGKAEMGTIPQYLTSIRGGAYVIFRVPEGDDWDPVNDASMKTTDLSKPKSKTYYAKIPIKYVLDAVEAIDNESKANAKRVPGVLDAGMTWVGATYCGLGVARKLSVDGDGNPIIREETGTYIYQDTNNSTDDFERGLVPELRRNGAKMPSWNHTLN